MMTRERELLQQALDALLTGYHQGTQDAIAAMRAALAAPEPEPVALESVHLTRDTRGMCVVRVNGRVAIRDNGDTVETKLQDVIDTLSTIMQFGGNVGILIEPVTADEAIGAATKLCGWSLRNNSSSTLAEVTIHDGNSSAARVVASINLAGNETHTVVFPRPLILTGGNGLWVEVVSGDITDGSAVYYED